MSLGWRLQGLIIAVLLAVSEVALGTTPGKALLALRVVSQGGGKASSGQIALRNGLLFGGWILAGSLAIFEHVSGYVGSTALPHPPLDWIILLWLLAPILSLLLFRPAPLHDLISRTKVVVVERGWWANALREFGSTASGGATWSLADRAARARDYAIAELGELKTASERLGLVGDGWQTPYAIGFVWRHVVAGQQLAAHDDVLARFRKNYPAEMETRHLLSEFGPSIFGIQKETILEQINIGELNWDQDSAIKAGSLEADRILILTKMGDNKIIDRHTLKIQNLYRRVNQLAERKGLSRLLIVPPKKAYAYLVARTLGAASFSFEQPDRDLARAIGIAR